jgi:Rod binding domain-containing protein
MDINPAKTSSLPATAAKPLDRPWLIRADHSNNLEAQSQIFVSQFFFGTLLKQMRSGSMGTGMFDGGSGGKSFQSMLDQRLAEGMSNTPAGRIIAENIALSITKKQHGDNLPNSLEEARKLKKYSPKSIRKTLKSSTSGDAALNATPSLDTKG